MELFREENYKVTLSPELKQIKEFNAIIVADKDRNKTFSKKVFSYIYNMYDYKSAYSGYPEKERHGEVLKALGVKDFKITDKIQAAIDLYKKLRVSPTIRLLSETRETLQTSVDMIKVLRNEIDNSIKELAQWKKPEMQLDGEATKEEVIEYEEVITSHLKTKQLQIKNTTENLEKLLSLSEKIPKNIKQLKELEEAVRTEESTSKRVKGGQELGAYEE